MTIEVKGLDDLERKLDKLADLQAKVKTLCERLGAIGVDIARTNFETAEYDGDNDVTVPDAEWKDGALYVHADGNAVLFIEFGTGVTHTSTKHPYHSQTTPQLAAHGEYGRKQGRKKEWAYPEHKGEGSHGYKKRDKSRLLWTSGNPPALAMYKADQEMRNRILEVAREVFK